mgnify:CR=1 FL=1
MELLMLMSVERDVGYFRDGILPTIHDYSGRVCGQDNLRSWI